MRFIFLIVVLLLLGVQCLFSQPRLKVDFNKTMLHSGDTLVFDALVENYKYRYGTLHLFIEDMAHERRWKFRYPIEDGYCMATLNFSDSLPSGLYAFNFLLRPQLVHILGQVKGKNPPETINYLAKADSIDVVLGQIKVDADGGFQLPNLMIDKKATFVFTPTKKTPDNWLDIALETPVDSFFYPLASHTAFVQIGKVANANDTALYSFGSDQFEQPFATLQNVTITARAKSPAEKLVEKFQGGWFNGRGYLFDGIDDNAIAVAGTVFDFLIGRVPGLDITINRVDFSYRVLWRGFEPVYFVDGMETDKEGILAIAANEIAAIKVLSPPFYGTSMGNAGGAIAVFTKHSNGGSKYGNKFRFVINGYTPQTSLWQ